MCCIYYNVLGGENYIRKSISKACKYLLKYVIQLTKNNGVMRKGDTILANFCPVEINSTSQIVQRTLSIYL